MNSCKKYVPWLTYKLVSIEKNQILSTDYFISFLSICAVELFQDISLALENDSRWCKIALMLNAGQFPAVDLANGNVYVTEDLNLWTHPLDLLSLWAQVIIFEAIGFSISLMIYFNENLLLESKWIYLKAACSNIFKIIFYSCN